MSDSTKLPDLLLEQLALDEYPDGVPGALESAQREQVERLQASNEAILDEYPPELVGPQIERRCALEQTAAARRSAWFYAVPAMASAAVVLLLVWFVVPSAPGQRDSAVFPEQVRIKGDARLMVHRQVKDASQEMASGSTAAAGDVLQLSYLAAGQTHGVIFSLDGLGAVTLHLPTDVGGSTLLLQGGAQSLPFAYELDDAPRFERFVFVTSSNVLVIEDLLTQARVLGPDETTTLDLPEGVSQHHFWVFKTESR